MRNYLKVEAGSLPEALILLVAVPQVLWDDLHVVEAVVRDDDVERVGEGEAAWAAELSLWRDGALDAGGEEVDGAHVAAAVDAEHLDAVAVAVDHQHAAAVVASHAGRAPACLGLEVLVDGVHVTTVAPAQHLHAQIAILDHEQPLAVARAAHRKRGFKLTGIPAMGSYASHVASTCIQYLQAVVAAVADDDVAGGVYSEAAGVGELASAVAERAHGENLLARGVVDGLDAVVALVCDDHIAVAVHRHALRPVELARLFARLDAAEAAHVGAVPAAQHLHAVVVVVANDDVAAVHGDTDGMVELRRQLAAAPDKRKLAWKRLRRHADD